MSEITGTSGAAIVINHASWKEAKALKKAVQRALGGSVESLDFKGGLAALLPVFLSVDGSDAVDAALWPCLAKSTRDLEKITEQTFDDLEARKDYYDIVFECAKVNLGPLWEGLASKLPPGLLQKRTAPDDTPK